MSVKYKTLNIYNSDGTPFNDLILHSYSYSSVIMSLDDKITGDVFYKNNDLEFSFNEYVLFNGIKYLLSINDPPTITKKGLKEDNNELKGMTKYSFTFYHPMILLYNIIFTDVAVSNDEIKYKSEDTTFYWKGTLSELVTKINKNLQGTPFSCSLQAEFVDSGIQSDVIQFQDQMISDVLNTAYETWEVPFIFDGYAIVFGRPSNKILDSNGEEFIFRLGQGLGLKNNDRTPKKNLVITRLFGCGGTDNIPNGYPKIVWNGNQTWKYTINNDVNQLNSYQIVDGIYNGENVKLIKHPFIRTSLMPSIYSNLVNKKINPLAEGYNPDIELKDFYDASNKYWWLNVKSYYTLKKEPSVGDAVYDISNYEIGTVSSFDKNNNLIIINSVSYYFNYSEEYDTIINENIPSCSKKVFDGSDKEVGDVKPSIVDMKYNNQEIDIIKSITWINDDKTTAINIDDTFNATKNAYVQGYFKIEFYPLGFDLYAMAAITSAMSINMTSGNCNGCTFEVSVDWDSVKSNFYVTQSDNTIVFTPNGDQRNLTLYPDSTNESISVIVKKDTNTFGTLMPNVYMQPNVGDKFVFLGIELPQIYITNSELGLDSEMKLFLSKNNVPYYEYPFDFDEFFLKNNENIVSQIKPNSIIKFEYLSKYYSLSVKELSIDYSEDKKLPIYKITLTDEISVVLNSVQEATNNLSKLDVTVSNIKSTLQDQKGVTAYDILSDLFTKIVSTDGTYIRANYSLFSNYEIGGFGEQFENGGTGLIKTVLGYDKLGGSYDNTDLTNTFNAYTTAKIYTDTLSSLASINSAINGLQGGSAMSITTTGTGNAITALEKNGTVITATKGATFSLSSHVHDFSVMTNKPSTLTGYGILDSYTKTQIDSNILSAQNSAISTAESSAASLYLPLAGIANSSKKLATTRSIFGNSFDGSADVTGALSNVTNITASGNINLGNTTYSSQNGIINKGGVRFLHDFNYGNNGTVTTSGNNLFIGVSAGNFTMGSTATAVNHASRNTGVGYGVLLNNTTGYSNSAIGTYALQNNTTGYNNSAIGTYALLNNTTGYSNSAIGALALLGNTTGNNNSAIGIYALQNNTTGNNNSAIGTYALQNNTTGYNNLGVGCAALLGNVTGCNNSGIGMNAGRYIADGSTANQTSNSSTYIGSYTKSLLDGDTNETVIGFNAIGAGSNSVVLGNSSVASVYLGSSVYNASLFANNATLKGALTVGGATTLNSILQVYGVANFASGVSVAGQLVSNLVTGTSPLSVSSTTLNTNLNADLLDGLHSTDFTGRKSWNNVGSIGHWSRVCKIEGTGNYMLTVAVGQINESNYYTYSIGLGYQTANIHQISSSNFTLNSGIQVRITRGSSDTTTFYIEVYETYDNDSDGLYTSNCSLVCLSGNTTGNFYTSYTATDANAVVCSILTSDFVSMVAQALKVIGNVDVSGNVTAKSKIILKNGEKEVEMWVNDDGLLIVDGSMFTTGENGAYKELS